MPGLSFKPLGAASFSTVLTSFALIGGAISTILALCVFASGSAISHRGGSEHLLLKDLALVSFDGLIANNDTSQFLVHLHWFMNSFAWEYPDAPEGIPKVGFAVTGLLSRFDIVKDLRKIAGELQLPKDTYDCERYGGFAPSCKNIFFEAWRSWIVMDGLPVNSWLTLIMLWSAIIICLLAMAQEWMIRKRPYWMRCRCLFLKRWCPCPKGTREEIEKLDNHTWDKVRVVYWCLVAVYFLLPAFQTSFTTVFFLKYVGHIEDRLPKGISMAARRDKNGEFALWVAFFASAVSALCMAIKWRVGRHTQGWIKGQKLPQLQRRDTESGNNASDERREDNGSGRYTD